MSSGGERGKSVPAPTRTGAAVRREHDLLGERELPASALFGIHALRASENFPLAKRPIRRELIHGFGWVKLAAANTNHRLGYLSDEVATALAAACQELATGRLDGHVLVDALQGGAGTSTNMAVNEVLANRALELLGRRPGEYSVISPSDHVNLHQSTNDTFPTALRVAALHRLRELEQTVTRLQESCQALEQRTSDVVKVGRTEHQDAVLVTLGREAGAWAEAFARDRWRVYKCQERLRVVNLGGTAIGTGLGAPRRYVFQVVDELRALTGLGLSRAENLVEATQNTDVFAEVSGILKALATNLFKISSDIRLLSSGPRAGLGELHIPALQAGSSMMPGKVNPVIPEAVTQAAMQVMGADVVIGLAVSAGSLELNPFLPIIAEHLLTSITLLRDATRLLADKCIDGADANRQRCAAHVQRATASITALVSEVGYEVAQRIALEVERTGEPVQVVAERVAGIDVDRFHELTSPAAVNRLGHPDGHQRRARSDTRPTGVPPDRDGEP